MSADRNNARRDEDFDPLENYGADNEHDLKFLYTETRSGKTGPARDAAGDFGHSEENWFEKGEQEAAAAGEAPEKRRSWLGRTVGKIFNRGNKEAAQEAEGIDTVAQGKIGDETVSLTSAESTEAAKLKARVYDAEHQLQTFDLRNAGNLAEQRQTLYWMYDEWARNQTRRKKPHNEFTEEVNDLYRQLLKNKDAKYNKSGSYSTLSDEENAMLKEAEGRNLTDLDIQQMINGERPWQIAGYERAMAMLKAEEEAEAQERSGSGVLGGVAAGAAIGAGVALAARRGDLLAGANPTKGQEIPASTVEIEQKDMIDDLLAKIEETGKKLETIRQENEKTEQDLEIMEEVRGDIGDDLQDQIRRLTDNLAIISEYAVLGLEPSAPGRAKHDERTYVSLIKGKLNELDQLRNDQERMMKKMELLLKCYTEALEGMKKTRAENAAKRAKTEAQNAQLNSELENAAFEWAKKISPADGKKIDDMQGEFFTLQKQIDVLEKSLSGLSVNRQAETNRKIGNLLERQNELTRQITALREKILKPVRRFIDEKRLKTGNTKEEANRKIRELLGQNGLRAKITDPEKRSIAEKRLQAGILGDMPGFKAVDEIAESYRAFETIKAESLARISAMSRSSLDGILNSDRRDVWKILSGIGIPESELKKLTFRQANEILTEAWTAARARREQLGEGEMSSREIEAAEDAYKAARANRPDGHRIYKKIDDHDNKVAAVRSNVDDADFEIGAREKHKEETLAERTINEAHERIESKRLEHHLGMRTRAKLEEDLAELRKVSRADKIGDILERYLKLYENEKDENGRDKESRYDVRALDKEDANTLKEELAAKIEGYLSNHHEKTMTPADILANAREALAEQLQNVLEKTEKASDAELLGMIRKAEAKLRDIAAAGTERQTLIDGLVGLDAIPEEGLDGITDTELKALADQRIADLGAIKDAAQKKISSRTAKVAQPPVAVAQVEPKKFDIRPEVKTLMEEIDRKLAAKQKVILSDLGQAKVHDIAEAFNDVYREQDLNSVRDKLVKMNLLSIDDAVKLNDDEIWLIREQIERDYLEIIWELKQFNKKQLDMAKGRATAVASTPDAGRAIGRPEAMAVLKEISDKLVAEQKKDLVDLDKMKVKDLQDELVRVRKVKSIKALRKKFVGMGYANDEQLNKLTTEEIKMIREQIEHDIEYLILLRSQNNAAAKPKPPSSPPAPDQMPQQEMRRGIRAEAWKRATDTLKRREATLSASDDPDDIAFMESVVKSIGSYDTADKVRDQFAESEFMSRTQANSLSDAEILSLRDELEASTRRALDAAKKTGSKPPTAAARQTEPRPANKRDAATSAEPPKKPDRGEPTPEKRRAMETLINSFDAYFNALKEDAANLQAAENAMESLDRVDEILYREHLVLNYGLDTRDVSALSSQDIAELRATERENTSDCMERAKRYHVKEINKTMTKKQLANGFQQVGDKDSKKYTVKDVIELQGYVDGAKKKDETAIELIKNLLETVRSRT